MSSDQRVKKLRGSGGYVNARVTDEEQVKGNLGGADLFLSPIGRLDPAVISRYYCNACEGEFDGSPRIAYDNPNEEVAQNLILVEKGQYACNKCSSTIAEYRTFKKLDESLEVGMAKPEAEIAQQPEPQAAAAQQVPEPQAAAAAAQQQEPVSSMSVRPITGMSVFDENGNMVGTAKGAGVTKDRGIVMIVQTPGGSDTVIEWSRVGKAGEIILLKSCGDTCCAEQPAAGTAPGAQADAPRSCPSCGLANGADAKFCESCGGKI